MIEVENLEKAKEKVNKVMAKSVYGVLNESYKDHNSSVYESINQWSLDRFSIGEVTNKTTGKVDFKIIEKEDLREEISSRTGNFTIKNYTDDEKNSDLKLYITDVKKNDETSKELTNIYNENKGKSKDEIIDKLIEYLEKKNVLDETIVIDDEKRDKANNYFKAIDLIETNIENTIMDKPSSNKITYEGNIIQKNDEQYFGINIKNKATKEEIDLRGKTLTELKEKVVDFVEKDLEREEKLGIIKGKDLILKQEKLEELKNTDFKDLKIETDKDFRLEFTDKNKKKDGYSYLLVIEDKKETILTIGFKERELKGMLFNITDKNFSDISDKTFFDIRSSNLKKVDYLKEVNKEIMKQVDENKEKESFKEVKADIIISSLEEVGRRQYENTNGVDKTLTYPQAFIKNIDDFFENRIGNLKDKSEFLEKRHEEFNLTLDENGKIKELSTDNEEEYKENVSQFLNAIKQNIKEEMNEKFDFVGKNEDDKYVKFQLNNEVENLKKEYLPDRNLTISLEKEFLRNAIPIMLSEDKMSLKKEELEKLSETEQKKELNEKINNYYNSMSESSKAIKIDFVLENNLYGFRPHHFDKFVKESEIKIPKEKKNKAKEVEKENTKDFGKEM